MGIKKPEAIQLDYTNLFKGKPSYKFYLNSGFTELVGSTVPVEYNLSNYSQKIK
ncbi:hypothetical protein [Pedobacter arcticus]|uniref:hypothetical protein n=1 Tax=Pedobacter arcticus TaxID=752140 RepID=UPI001872DD85|nr:hypothetical protein [Pedobacter arcticus]